MLVNLSVEGFNQELGSNSPAPGGGSVAALSGALGGNLVSMVCQLSIGKEAYVEEEAMLKEVLEEVRSLSASLLERVDLDTQAFNGVMAAFKLPKETDEEKEARKEAIQAGYQQAVQSPYAIATECLQVLKQAARILGKSNPNALSDLGVAAQQALAGLEGAVMNVRINLPSIKDEKFVQEKKSEVAALLEEGGVIQKKIYNYVQQNIG